VNHRAYLVAQLGIAHDVLDDPSASDRARRRARCRINRTAKALQALPPVPQMKRGLDIDRTPVWLRPAARSAS
jgi:hypothetical protein